MKGRFFNWACILVVVLLCSCTGKDYKSVIPSDSDVVVMVNLKSIVEKAGLENSKTMALAKENMGIVFSPKDKSKALGLIDDPAKIGIDFREPACMFVRRDGSMGLVMKVADKDNLEDFMSLLRGNSVMSKAVEKDGVMCCKLLDEVGVFYNDEALLLYANKSMSTSDRDTKEACALMKQDEDMSYKSTYNFDSDTEYKDVVVMCNDIKGGMKSLLPDDFAKFFGDMADMPALITMQFEKGRMAVEAEMKPVEENDVADVKEVNKNLHKIKGDFGGFNTEYVPVWMYAGVNGQWLLKELKKNADVKEYLFMLERCIDIEQMIAAVDGDIIVGMQPNKDKAITAIARVKNTGFLSDVDYWTKSMKEYGASMDRMSANDYCLKFGDSDTRMFWGVKDNDLYISTISRPEYGTGKMVKTLATRDITGCWLYLYVDMVEMQKLMGLSTFQMMGNSLKFESIVAKSKEYGKLSIDFNVKNKDMNVLQYLIE